MTNFEPLIENTSQDPLVKKLGDTFYHPLINFNRVDECSDQDCS